MATRPKPVPVVPQPVENRDPNNINSHLNVEFADVIAEPPAPQSVDFVWECSEIFFDCFKLGLYKLFSLLCGVCIAIYWGLMFVPAFWYGIWVCTPFTQCVKIGCAYPMKMCCKIVLRACVTPCTRACGEIFHVFGSGEPRAESPIFPPRKPRPKPQPKPVEEKPKEEKKVSGSPAVPAVLVFKSEFEDYDKEKVRKSVRRQLMLDF